MKLDTLLKDARKNIPDDGFSDQVMKALPRQAEKSGIGLLDQSTLEVAAIAAGVFLLASRLPWAPHMLNSLTTSTTLLAAVGLGLAYWLNDSELFE